MTKNFIDQLKDFNQTLYQIHVFIMDAAKLGYGEISFDVKSHDYVSKIVEMRAVKPNSKDLPKSIGKKVIIVKEKGGKNG